MNCAFRTPRYIFDPGTFGIDVGEFSQEELSYVSDMFALCQLQTSAPTCPVIIAGECELKGFQIELSKILMDSGALHGSYISKEWVDSKRELLRPNLRKVNGAVKMGDNKTLVQIKEILRINVLLTRPSNNERRIARVDLAVLDMNGGLDAIIGLPDILCHYLDVFIDLLEQATPMESVRPAANDALAMMTLSELKETYPDLVDTWSQEAEDVAQEELDTEEPCSFTGPLYYLTKPYEEVLTDYYNMFDSHIAPEWRHDPRLLELLSSEEALAVFVPRVWTGIVGVDPIELEFSEDMPKTHKPFPRPLNPKMKEAAVKEFERMCTYMYGISLPPP